MSQSQTSLNLPILDMSHTPSSSFLSTLLDACKNWGFFHIINHGISQEHYKKLSFFSHQMFNLPLETKLKLGPSSNIKSYTPQFIASPFYEGLKISGPDLFASAECSGKILFAHQSSEFSQTVQEYGHIMASLCKRIIEFILMSLGEGFEKFQETEFSKSHGYLRIINYTPPGTSSTQDEDVEGLGKHTDMSCMTVLYTDDLSSLEVRSKEGQWTLIEPCEGSIVVNLGDMLEAWSNGKLRSSEHRVVLRKQRNRLCFAFFWSFEDDKVIFAPEEIVGEGNKRVFKPFVCSDYVKFREFDDKEKYEKVGNSVRDFAGLNLMA